MDGRSVHYDPPIEWYALTRSVVRERMEQVWEFDGEQAYEKMKRAMERASQPPTRDRQERRRPGRTEPERDYGPPAAKSLSQGA